MQNPPYLKAANLLVASLLFVTSMLGQHGHKAVTVVVVAAAELPEAAQMPADSMYLHSGADGTTFLYLEQQVRHRIVVLNVSAPSKIRLEAFVPMNMDEPFDFVRSAGPTAALVCFRGEKGSGIVDFSKPRNPILTTLPSLRHSSQIEEAGPAGLIVSSGERPYLKAPSVTVQVVDISSPTAPRIVYTVASVFQQLSDSTTGARYLLSETGLTVVRQPDVESERQVAAQTSN